MGFFTLLAFAPFPLDMTASQVGWVFFGWGLLLAFTSVVLAPVLQRRFGTVPTVVASLALFAADLAAMAIWTEHETVIATCIVVAGAFLGVINTLVTEAVMGAAPVERPVASAAYSFVRFTGGAVGPYVAMKLFEHQGVHAPFWFGAAAVAVGVVVIAAGSATIRRALAVSTEPAHGSQEEAEAELVGDLA
jgi:MFS transporter, ACDE family, multidrug resistance protein